MDAKKHILILGGDGYLGWTAAMHFSALGYDVTAADNYFRRQVCQAEGIDFLWPVPRLPERSAAWHRQCGGRIRVAEADLAVAADMRALFEPEGYEKLTGAPWPGRPLAVLHLAEQPSAPYSLLRHESTAFTVVNNLGVTTNLLCAVRDLSPDSQIVHIGTMGYLPLPSAGFFRLPYHEDHGYRSHVVFCARLQPCHNRSHAGARLWHGNRRKRPRPRADAVFQL